MKPQLVSYTKGVNENDSRFSSPDVQMGNNNNYDNDKKPKHKYVKVLVKDPFNNRDIILKVAKNPFSTLAKNPEGNSGFNGLNPNWVTGFCDAESCIGFRIRKNNKLKIG